MFFYPIGAMDFIASIWWTALIIQENCDSKQSQKFALHNNKCNIINLIVYY